MLNAFRPVYFVCPSDTTRPTVATIHSEDAAAMVALFGDGARIVDETGNTLWREGSESQPAAESYDYCGNILRDRLK